MASSLGSSRAGRLPEAPLLSHGDSAIHDGWCCRQQLEFQMIWSPRILQPNLDPH
jgi:hypothetical protein